MRGVLIGGLLAMLGLAVVACGPKDGPKDAPKIDPAIIGQWEWVSMNGRPAAIPRTVTFKEDGVTIERDVKDGFDYPGRYAVDPKASPAHFDYVHDDGSRFKGIYKVDGDKLTICYAQGVKKDRPTEFKAMENEVALMVYQRVKPKG
jgi:uncharacterized protein (TIGR03067 family)